MTNKLILVTGASGYIASRLIPRLLEQNYGVHELARRPEQLAARHGEAALSCSAATSPFQPVSTRRWMEFIPLIILSIHNMTIGRGYTRIEIESAHHFALATEHAGVQHVVYLGGLSRSKCQTHRPAFTFPHGDRRNAAVWEPPPA